MTETPASDATSAITARWMVAISGAPVVEPVECRDAVDRIEPDGASQEPSCDLGREITTVEFGQHLGRAVGVLVAQGDRVGAPRVTLCLQRENNRPSRPARAGHD